MDLYQVFSFWVILKESFKLIPKHWKLFASVSLLSVLLSVIVYVAFDFSLFALAQTTEPDETSFMAGLSSFRSSLSSLSRLQDEYDDMGKILAITFAVEVGFMFVLLIIFFFTTLATILIAAVSYTGGTLSIKDLFSRIFRTWTKLLLTSIYVSIHSLGFLPILVLFAVPVLLYSNIITVLVSIFLTIVVVLFYLYLVVNWALAVVVSVVEHGCYGMVAMGRASELAKGQRIKGYMLSLLFFLVNLIIAVIYVYISGFSMPSSPMVFGLLLEILAPLVGIYQVIAYTVLYFHCKKEHGEEAEIHIGDAKYSLLPSTSPVN